MDLNTQKSIVDKSKKESGSTMIEYALVVVFMSVLLIGGISVAARRLGVQLCTEVSWGFGGGIVECMIQYQMAPSCEGREGSAMCSDPESPMLGGGG